MKVFLIDDDENLVNIFTAALTKEGFETASALTGEDGLAKVKTEKPDIILLDQVLPDMSGNDILKTLKQGEIYFLIPVILLSNFSQEELVKGAIDEGAIDYLFKYQVEPKDVVVKVKEALKIQ
ncbi:response regulator [Patescibacteria group bacterium]|nr:response regulator [Patescibacteria group bacterium]